MRAHLSSGKGRRVCFVCAITLKGIVVGIDENGAIYTTKPNSDEAVKNAFHLFTAAPAAKIADYHGNFDKTKFVNWLTNMLLPALKAQYPECFPSADSDDELLTKLFFVMDNAPYHRFNSDDTPCVDKISRQDLVAMLKVAPFNLTQITVRHETITPDNKKEYKDLIVELHEAKEINATSGGPGRARVGELREAFRDLIRTKPELRHLEHHVSSSASFHLSVPPVPLFK